MSPNFMAEGVVHDNLYRFDVPVNGVTFLVIIVPFVSENNFLKLIVL